MVSARAAADRLEHSGRTLRSLLTGRSAEDATWHAPPGKWSILEVACHLLDEEREDFRQRLRLVLEDPNAPWPPIDPEGWVLARDYASRDLDTVVASFVVERDESVRWLRSLENPAWDRERVHPRMGSLRAGDLLAAWLAHDLLHIRQLVALDFALTTRAMAPFSTEYAGRW
jgi:hypothetical protein